jgi:hypothetical protein
VITGSANRFFFSVLSFTARGGGAAGQVGKNIVSTRFKGILKYCSPSLIWLKRQLFQSRADSLGGMDQFVMRSTPCCLVEIGTSVESCEPPPGFLDGLAGAIGTKGGMGERRGASGIEVRRRRASRRRNVEVECGRGRSDSCTRQLHAYGWRDCCQAPLYRTIDE